MFKATMVAIAALAVLVLGLAVHSAAQASAAPMSRGAVCASQAPNGGAQAQVSKIGSSGLTWQYVTRREARYFHISPCSVAVIGHNRYGSDATVIVTPRGRVVAQS